MEELILLQTLKRYVNANTQEYSGLWPGKTHILSEETKINIGLLEKFKNEDCSVLDIITLKLIDTKSLIIGPVLGEGNFGITYSGELNGRNVAVKKLKGHLTLEQKADLYKEAVMMQVNTFPGVIEFIGVDDATAPTMIVMEAAVCSLDDWLHGVKNTSSSSEEKKANIQRTLGDLTMEDKAKILIQCCSTFAFLHNIGVIHRDIKPGNVLIMADRSCRVTDFGLAQQKIIVNFDSDNNKVVSRVTANNPMMNSRGTTVKGTYAYMAPELILADEDCIEYSEATDVYAFGVMCNELMTSVRPCDGMSDNQIIVKMIETDAERVDMSYMLLLGLSENAAKPFHESTETNSLNCVDDLQLTEILQGHYTGEMRNGLRHGQGTLKCLNGDTYVGEWLSDKRHGYGKWTTPIGYLYEGCWLNDLCHGAGYTVYSNGDTYRGNRIHQIRQGHGVHTFANGDVYEGHFNGYMEGHGTLTYTNNDVYVGVWKHDLKHGKGCLTKADGSQTIEVWNEGELEMQGDLEID